jgi:hypothetical protein
VGSAQTLPLPGGRTGIGGTKMRNPNSLSISLPEKAGGNIISSSIFISNILLLLIFVSLTFRFQLRVPGKGYYATLANLLVIYLIFSWAVYMLYNRTGWIKTRLDLPFIIFSVAIILGLVKGALLYGINQDYLGNFRYFMQFFLFFIVTSLRFNKATLSNFITKLFIIIIISSIIVSTYSILISLFGFEHPLDTANPWEFHELLLGDVKRSAPFITSNILIIIPVVLIALLYMRELSVRQFIGLFCCNIFGIFFTMTRTIWLCVVISILFFILLNKKGKIFSRLMPLMISLILIICLLGYVQVIPTEIIHARLDKILVQSPEELGSVAHRIAESLAYYELFLENPVWGGGIGSTVTFYSLARAKVVTRSSWHNAYAMLLGKLGLFGFLGFVFILWRLYRESVYILKHDPDIRVQILMKTFLAILAALLISTLAISSLISYDFTILLVTLAAIIGIYGHYLRNSLKA